MADALSAGPSLTQAREMFFQHGQEPSACVAPHISRSWQRSRPLQQRLLPVEPVSGAQLDERREQAFRLLACAQPELDGLAEHAVDRGCVVILSDAEGLILQEIGSPEFLPRAEQFALKPGVAWSEHRCGTNAIGTALVERQALMVLGAEHFLAQNAGLGCAASPIFDGRGEVAGVLDISGETARITRDALGLVRMAAGQVEHRLLLAGAQGHLLRFHTKPALIGTPREGLIVIADGRIAAANRCALDLLGVDWADVLDHSAEGLLGRRFGRVECQRGLLTLPDGRQVAGVLERTAAAAPAATPAIAERARLPLADDVQPLLDRALRVLDAGVPVLVRGETGSGKDVFARRLHAASRRRAGPLVAVDCASLPENLIEAELFGYEDGAFTGARRRGMPGRIRQADGGLLFLDEIAEMPLGLQTRLLRVLEERVVVPLGGGRGVPVDFDLVCATHQDLAALVQAGRFRADLMYRVAGFSVVLPALRERADRGELVQRLFAELGGDAKALRLDDEALARLQAYPWPGNLRELRSVLTALVALAEPGQALCAADLPGPIAANGAVARPPALGRPAPGRPAAPMPGASLKEASRHAIEEALSASGHDVAEAARQLGVHRSTVYRHLERRRRQATPSPRPHPGSSP